jgi:hypothetical protein
MLRLLFDEANHVLAFLRKPKVEKSALDGSSTKRRCLQLISMRHHFSIGAWMTFRAALSRKKSSK